MNYLQDQQYLAGLNDQQREAVLCRSNIVYVSAGPGSGKTHMLTSKLLDFILTSDTPQKIVALSYTNTAARQIGERFHKKASQIVIDREYSFYNGTIHSFCFKMMKSFRDSFDYTILDDEELSELAEDIKAQLPSNIPQKAVMNCLKSDPKEAKSSLYQTVSNVKAQLGVISVQDILTLFLQMLDIDEEFRYWMAGEVTVMAFDEAQDLSELNYRILDRMLDINPRLKVFLVGDPRQNIFEFNGGSYKNLDEFLSHHTGYAKKTLTITYRCGQPITDFVNKFSFSDCENYQLLPVNTGGSLSVFEALTEESEAERVLQGILDIGNINQCAVLSNNLRYLSTFISLLRSENIPYKVFGGIKLLKKHVRFLNHVLRIIDNENAYSIRKIAQYAGIDIVRDGKKRKSAFFDSDLGQIILSIRDEAEFVPFSETAQRVIHEIMEDPGDEEEVTKDYTDFLSFSSQYASVSDYLVSFATDKERFSSFYRSDYEECQIPTDTGFLTISTIHSAKGLEWDNVFIMGLCEGNFPNPFFCKSLPPAEQQEFFNAEWKKMYVASTRARKNLYLTFAKIITRKGYSFRKEPSRFIGSQPVCAV